MLIALEKLEWCSWPHRTRSRIWVNGCVCSCSLENCVRSLSPPDGTVIYIDLSDSSSLFLGHFTIGGFSWCLYFLGFLGWLCHTSSASEARAEASWSTCCGHELDSRMPMVRWMTRGLIDLFLTMTELRSGNLLHSYGKSLCSIWKLALHCHFQ